MAHFYILLRIIFSQSTQNAIPKQKIKRIITCKILVVLVMIDRCIDPTTQFAIGKTPGE
jgi:hypothetical protein